MNNPFRIGDSVMHDVEAWQQPASTLTVTYIKNLVVVAVDKSLLETLGALL
ncbi:hypothetical protein ACFODO_20655 [Acinetobacter sichuanensis]|uniref:Uncharacterized protein n=1 Tax=Acinetobacter sichuanensis TaxID=2136183 RepID=A0ABV7BLQ7_9GAMM|nr:hypothetical protein [Acinetobacter sichuanensis]